MFCFYFITVTEQKNAFNLDNCKPIKQQYVQIVSNSISRCNQLQLLKGFWKAMLSGTKSLAAVIYFFKCFMLRRALCCCSTIWTTQESYKSYNELYENCSLGSSLSWEMPFLSIFSITSMSVEIPETTPECYDEFQ